jgi:hypothetical protein
MLSQVGARLGKGQGVGLSPCAQGLGVREFNINKVRAWDGLRLLALDVLCFICALHEPRCHM